jgi:phenylalanyl-tRNA synthetase beta subunit
MAKIRDRTEDFKDAVRHIAISLGYNEVKILIFLLLFYSLLLQITVSFLYQWC